MFEQHVVARAMGRELVLSVRLKRQRLIAGTVFAPSATGNRPRQNTRENTSPYAPKIHRSLRQARMARFVLSVDSTPKAPRASAKENKFADGGDKSVLFCARHGLLHYAHHPVGITTQH
jgi:hypothetical protein